MSFSIGTFRLIQVTMHSFFVHRRANIYTKTNQNIVHLTYIHPDRVESGTPNFHSIRAL